MVTEVPAQLANAGVPPQVVAQFSSGSGGSIDLTGTGDLGKHILASLPAQAQATIAPLIPSIVDGIHQAFSIALASTFWVGIIGALVGAAAVAFLQEAPMRKTFEMGESTDEPKERLGPGQLIPEPALSIGKRSPCAN
jgi:hypothetical protein